jgi:hypothetical protein
MLGATWSLRAHYCDDVRAGARGNYGPAICNGSIEVFDDNAITARKRKVIRVVELPLCKACEKRAAKQGGAS